MPEETKLTKQQLLNIRYAMLGENPSPTNPKGFLGVLSMRIPAGKFSYNIAEVGEVTEEQGNKILKELHKIRKENKEDTKVEDDFLESEVVIKILKLPAASLEKLPEITPMHLKLLKPIIEGDFTKD